MSNRTDAHRPSAIVVGEYEFLGCVYHGPRFDLGDMMENNQTQAVINRFMVEKGAKFSMHEHGGSCMVCGAHALYLGVFYHAKSNSLIEAGQECTNNINDCGNSFDRMRKIVSDAREFSKGKAKAKAVLAENGLSSAWEIYEKGGHAGKEEGIILDMIRNLVKWGSFSEKQVSFMKSLVWKVENRAELFKAREIEHAAAEEVPVGRGMVSGVVLSRKVVESTYGEVTKILVKSDKGFKVYGNLPSSVNANVGDKVSFKATIEKSKDDAKFGFFSRAANMAVEVKVA